MRKDSRMVIVIDHMNNRFIRVTFFIKINIRPARRYYVFIRKFNILQFYVVRKVMKPSISAS